MFFKNFKFKNKLIILLGEEGAVLLRVKNNILLSRYFVKDASEFTDLKFRIKLDKKTQIYLVLNHIDQDYSLQDIPSVDKFSVHFIVKAKLKHISNNYALKAAFLLSKPNKLEKNWQYMFVSIVLSNTISNWIKLIINTGSNFKGILLLPIEMINVLSAISTLEENKQDSNNNWNIMVVYTKTGGFRQLVTKNNRMIFTRIISSSTDDTLPNIVAGSIYQEIQSTIQYLRRFDFHKDDSVNLHIIVPQDIKFGLMEIKFSEYSVNILTPHELSKILELTHVINPSDKFCDTVLLLYILENKPKVLLHTKETRKYSKLILFNLYFPHLLSSTLMLLLTINTLFIFNLYLKSKEKNSLMQDNRILNTHLQKVNNNYSVKKIYEISEIIDIHNELSNLSYSPLSEIEYISKVKSDGLKLKSFYWKIDDETDQVSMRLKYYLKSDGDTFYKYEDLKRNFNITFYDYKVAFSQLPSVIEIGEKDIKVNINISKLIKK